MIRPILSVLACASFFVAGPRAAEAAVLTVDCVGGPFLNINVALAASVPGDTILVHVCTSAAAVYPPFALAGVSSVSIVAADAWLPYVGAQRIGVTATPAGFAPPVIVDGTGVAGSCASVTGSSDVEITGFALRNCGTYGVYVQGSDRVSITGNRIDTTGQAGIRVSNAGYDDVRLVGNLIYHAAKTGIALMGGTRLYTADNTVLGSGREGIYADIPAVTSLINNNVTGSVREGIVVRGAAGEIARNTSVGNLVGAGFCEIYLDPASAANSVIGNYTTGAIPGFICGALAANFVQENR